MEAPPQFIAFLNSVLATIVWVIVGTVLLYLSLRLFDRLDPVDFKGEVQRGNVAAGIVLAGYLVGLSMIIGVVIHGP